MDRISDRSGATDRARNLTLAATSLGFAVVQLDVTIVNTALNAMGRSLGGGIAPLQWVVNAYTIAFAALILSAGAFGDRNGARRVFMSGFLLFTLASLACALAPGIGALIAARAVQGAGAALLVPNSLGLLNHAYENPAARGRAVGIWAAGASLAITAGPIAGGALTDWVSWRSIFLVNLPIGACGLWLTWRWAEDTPAASNRRVDLPGQVLAMLALGLLAAAIIESGRRGLNDVLVVSAAAACLILSALFVVRERAADQPMLPLALFKSREFTVATLIGLMANIAFYGLIFVLSIYFQRAAGYSPLMTGVAFIPLMGAVLPVNLLAPRIAERIGAKAVIATGAVIACLGALALISIGPDTNYVAIVGQMIALGGGLGLLVPPMTSMLLGSVERRFSGIASGVLNSARQTGSVIGVAVFGALLSGSRNMTGGARASLLIAAALLGVSALVAILSRSSGGDRKRRRQL
jgi:DHA2 family methylenomycin A resistance protein-like MFS transporter